MVAVSAGASRFWNLLDNDVRQLHGSPTLSSASLVETPTVPSTNGNTGRGQHHVQPAPSTSRTPEALPKVNLKGITPNDIITTNIKRNIRTNIQ